MASVLAPPVQVVTANAPPFVQVPSGAPPFVAVSGNAPPIMIVEGGAPPITLFNEDGSVWSAHTPAGGEVLLEGESDGFATDFLHEVDAERVAVKTAGTVVSSGLSFFTNAGVSSKWVYDVTGTLVNVAAGSLALDYDPVTHAARGLLVEPQATNLATHSNDLSTALTPEGGTVTLNNQTGPDAASTADTFTENTAGGVTHALYGNVGTTASGDYTVSRFYKMGTRRYATVALADGTNGAYAVYDLQSGVVGSSAAIGAGTLNSASIQSVGNGWYRCILSCKAPGTNPYYTFGAATAATITQDGYGRQVFTGTGLTLFFGHVQIEAGTVATSPIPTTSATVTRAADAYNCTAASIGNSATAGSWWAETYLLEGAGDRLIIGRNASAVPLFYNSTAFEMSDGTLLYKLVSGLIGNVKRGAVAFTAGDRAITGGGLAPSTDAGATTNLLNPTTIYLGGGAGAPALLGYIRKVRYLPRRMSNADLQTETAP